MVSSSSVFEVSDAVHVESAGGKQLEGVVAFTGQVEFAEGDDWVGVRLTGASVGLGKNNGQVKGKRYFTCGPNGGVFVRASNVSKRVLTRLEELRLKRELSKIGATATANSGSIGGSQTSGTSPRSRIPTAATISKVTSGATPVTSPKPTGTAKGPGGGVSSSARKKSTRSKLDELRERREALAKSRGVSTSGIAAGATGGLASIHAVENHSQHNLSPASSLTASRAPSPPPGKPTAATDERVNILTRQAEELETNLTLMTEKLKSKENENESLQESLRETQQQVVESQEKAKAVQEELASTQEKASQDIVSQLKEALSVRQGELYEIASHYFSSSGGGNMEECKAEIERLNDDLFRLEGDKRDLTADVEKYEEEAQQLRADLVKEREGRIVDANELTEVKAAKSALEHELKAINDLGTKRGESDASHYKAQAKLQAELGAAKRTIEQLENEKLDMETTLEELSLDKDQLQEEKETLEDRLEELRIDSETAQMEVEELKLELEDVRAAAESAAAGSALQSAGAGAVASSTTQDGVDAADVAQALGVQNARLREALIRLREQSSVEKMELSRQLRAVEKEAAAGKEVMIEVETLRSGRANLEEQINDLKEMLEQGSAFESMVEDLSDRVMALEDANIVLQSTIQEMEEAADVTAEMEEVQADENKYLMKDLEGRDALIRNLEEAIRMQRRREEDFQRTVTNYRNSVETLKQEKTLLLELQQGQQGDKEKMMASSQKALERAALLVSDAANVRKKEAEAAFDRIEAHITGHLAERLESFLPQSVVASELASAKGELLISKVVGKASLSLDGIATIFSKKIRVGMNETLSVQELDKEDENEEEKENEAKGEEEEEEEGEEKTQEEEVHTIMTLSDEANQGTAAMIHQSKFALTFVDVAADMLRLLSAGQWPDLLTPEQSAELGALTGHSISLLDLDLSHQLKVLKEEGILSPHQTNLGAFEQSVRNTMQELNTAIENDGNVLLSPDWTPPGWELFKAVSIAKFSCLGAGAVIASAVGSDDTDETGSIEIRRTLKLLMTKLDQVTAQASKVCLRLSRLNVNDEKCLSKLSVIADQWKDASVKLFEGIQGMVSDEGLLRESVRPCEDTAEEILRSLVNFSFALRAVNLNDESERGFHPLSPEIDDPWEGVRNLAQAVRVIDGDAEDVNCLMRARAIEERLEDAVNNESKLSLANAKVTSLEKSLSSRSREIAMQNARLAELENLLAKTNAKTSSPKKKSVELSVSAEMNKTKEENRMLTEAMEVLQTQVDEYERELRFFKDTKSPKGRRAPAITSRGTPRRSSSNIADYGPEKGKRFDFVGDGGHEGSKLALEAALLRPALQSARRETAAWKSKAFGSAMVNLPALNVPGAPSSEEEKIDESDVAYSCSRQLELARADARITKASISVLNLKGIGENATARSTFQDMLAQQKKSLAMLEKANTAANQLLLSKNAPFAADGPGFLAPGKLVGKVSIPGTSGNAVTHKIVVKSGDLSRLNMHLLR
mmetsp:Transcript_13107/g.18555  ORF Transcript_13107/g.18555 Transcript_13107/m.18555 type:complete len:1498 (+) Transcript_13107:112-4605(+)